MADTTTTSRLYSEQQPGRTLLFSTEQSNADKRRLDWERFLCHSVASFGESWDRDPGVLSRPERNIHIKFPIIQIFYSRNIFQLFI